MKLADLKEKALCMINEGFTQKEIAKELKTTEQTICRWKKEEVGKFKQIDRNIRKLNVHIDKVLDNEVSKSGELKDLCYCMITLIQVRKELTKITLLKSNIK